MTTIPGKYRKMMKNDNGDRFTGDRFAGCGFTVSGFTIYIDLSWYIPLRYIALLAKRIVGLCGVRARASDSCAFANHKHIVVDATALRCFEDL